MASICWAVTAVAEIGVSCRISAWARLRPVTITSPISVGATEVVAEDWAWAAGAHANANASTVEDAPSQCSFCSFLIFPPPLFCGFD